MCVLVTLTARHSATQQQWIHGSGRQPDLKAPCPLLQCNNKENTPSKPPSCCNTHSHTRTPIHTARWLHGIKNKRHVRSKSRGLSNHTYWQLNVNFRAVSRFIQHEKYISLCLSFWAHVTISIRCSYICVNVKKKAFYLWLDVCMHICVCVSLHDAPTSPLCNNATITLWPVCIEHVTRFIAAACTALL